MIPGRCAYPERAVFPRSAKVAGTLPKQILKNYNLIRI
jgi:hypothetical protein